MCATHVLCKSLVCTLHTLLEPQPSPAVPSIWLSAKTGRKLALTATDHSAMQFSLICLPLKEFAKSDKSDFKLLFHSNLLCDNYSNICIIVSVTVIFAPNQHVGIHVFLTLIPLQLLCGHLMLLCVCWTAVCSSAGCCYRTKPLLAVLTRKANGANWNA